MKDKVTPELTAYVVKNCVLPMFKTREKASDSNTVFGELKLSEKLSNELEKYKFEKAQLEE